MHQTLDLKTTLFEDISGVEKHIQKALQQINNTRLQAAAGHILDAGGKRIRPALMLTSYKAVGGKELEKAYAVGAAIELIHNWTLIHDDIIDESETRRGVSTVHKQWDQDVAILAGDMLNNLAFGLVCDSGFEPSVVQQVIRVLSAASMDVVDGEMMDVDFEKQSDLDEEDYFEMIGKKTGALFSASAILGAVTGTSDQTLVTALEKYGSHIGLAFQIQDDLLDLTADGSVFGKEIGKDIIEGKKTLMVLHALRHTDARSSARLQEILRDESNSPQEIEAALEIMHDAGSMAFARQVLDGSVRRAIGELEVLPESEHRQVLEELAHYIKNRIN